MPHMYVDRPRVIEFGIISHLRKGKNEDQETARIIQAGFYEMGGLLFILGSVLFFPAFEEYETVGTCLYLSGSCLYLVVNVHGLYEMTKYIMHSKQQQDEDNDDGLSTYHKVQWLNSFIFVLGTLAYMSGSISFLTIGSFAGGVCLMTGSFLFLVGSILNLIMSAFQNTTLQIQITIVAAMSFSLGSVLIFMAAVPYTFDTDDMVLDAQGKMYPVLKTMVAAQFITGSLLFLVGGVFSYCREK